MIRAGILQLEEDGQEEIGGYGRSNDVGQIDNRYLCAVLVVFSS